MPGTYLICFFGLSIAAFLIFRIFVRNDYISRGKLSVLSYFLEFIIFALHANFLYLFSPLKWPELPEYPYSVYGVIAKIILYIGLFIVFAGISGLGIGKTMGQNNIKLKKDGMYKYSRNPQAIGYGLFLISIIIIYPSFYSIGWFILFVFIIALMIKTEEEFLILKYGNEYREYCRKVPRYL